MCLWEVVSFGGFINIDIKYLYSCHLFIVNIRHKHLTKSNIVTPQKNVYPPQRVCLQFHVGSCISLVHIYCNEDRGYKFHGGGIVASLDDD